MSSEAVVTSPPAAPLVTGLDGAKPYRRLQALKHPLARRFIVVTGDVLGPDTRAFLEASGVTALSKPLMFDELRGVIREVVARAE